MAATVPALIQELEEPQSTRAVSPPALISTDSPWPTFRTEAVIWARPLARIGRATTRHSVAAAAVPTAQFVRRRWPFPSISTAIMP